MAKRIFKYPIVMAPFFDIEMPQFATILNVQVQNGLPVFWALIDDEKPIVITRFRVYETGHEISEIHFRTNLYVGTWQEEGFVFHIFQNCPMP